MRSLAGPSDRGLTAVTPNATGQALALMRAPHHDAQLPTLRTREDVGPSQGMSRSDRLAQRSAAARPARGCSGLSGSRLTRLDAPAARAQSKGAGHTPRTRRPGSVALALPVGRGWDAGFRSRPPADTAPPALPLGRHKATCPRQALRPEDEPRAFGS